MSESQLSKLLEDIAELYDRKETAERGLKAIKGEIATRESLAVELLAASGLDGVRAAGKSWYLRDFWGVNIPADKKADVVAAARSAGLDDYITVNTSSLKSWLTERHNDNGSNGDSLTAGTPFEGLVSEYHETRLSRQTRGE